MSNLLATQQTFSLNVSKLITHIFDQQHTCTFSDAYRPPELAALYAKEGKGISDSQHCHRLAVDLNIFDAHNNLLATKDQFEKFGEYWEKLDTRCRWGGRFVHLVDLVHFEMHSL